MTATHVRTWLQSLGTLTAISRSDEETALVLETYTHLLAERFPAAAFCAASLDVVASLHPEGFPTYGALVAALSGWWAAHRPPPKPPRSMKFLETPEPEMQEEFTPEELDHMSRVAAGAHAFLDARIAADPAHRPTPKHLSPELLDAINPLPNGRKRSHAPADPRDA